MKPLAKVLLGCCYVLITACIQTAVTANTKQAITKDEKAATKPSEFSLLGLQRKLKRTILPKYPETIFEQRPFQLDRDPYSLIIHFQSNNYTSHITEIDGNLSKEETEKFPADFSEFILRLELTSDYYTYTHKLAYPTESSQPFGATFMNRYNMKVLSDDVPGTTVISDTPDHKWLYNAYDLLYPLLPADLVPNRHRLAMGELTRMEIAMATARLTDKNNEDNMKAREKINKNPELTRALKVLQQEFARELAEFGLHPDGLKTFGNGKTWPTRYEFLSLNFSYGKGFDAKLRTQIEHTIADYTAAWLKSNSSTKANATSK